MYLGDDTRTGHADRRRVMIGGIDSVQPRAVDIGFGAVCAGLYATLPSTATYHCWGDWDGCGAMDSLTPASVGVQSVATLLTVGESYACRVNTNEKRMACWGKDLLTPECHEEQYEPFRLTDITEAQLGRNHGCFIRGTTGLFGRRTLYCWGNNDYGQLGNGTTDASADPVQVVFATEPPL